MALNRARRENAGKGVHLEDYLGGQLRSAEFRHHFTERRMVHEVALALRALRDQAGLTQAELARKIEMSGDIRETQEDDRKKAPETGALDGAENGI